MIVVIQRPDLTIRHWVDKIRQRPGATTIARRHQFDVPLRHLSDSFGRPFASSVPHPLVEAFSLCWGGATQKILAKFLLDYLDAFDVLRYWGIQRHELLTESPMRLIQNRPPIDDTLTTNILPMPWSSFRQTRSYFISAHLHTTHNQVAQRQASRIFRLFRSIERYGYKPDSFGGSTAHGAIRVVGVVSDDSTRFATLWGQHRIAALVAMQEKTARVVLDSLFGDSCSLVSSESVVDCIPVRTGFYTEATAANLVAAFARS